MKIRRIALFLITIVCILSLFSVVASADATENKSRIVDKNDFISSSDEAKLEARLREAEENSGVKFRVYVYEYYGYGKPLNMDIYEKEVGESVDNIVLLVVSYEYGEYYYEMFSKGTKYTGIKQKEADKILDNSDVYDNIKSGKLYEGIDAYITLAEKAAVGNLRNSFKSVFIPSIFISLAVSIGIAVYVAFKYRRKLHSVSYPLEKYANLNLNVANDNFINKTITRVRVNNSSNSSRGSGRRSSGSGSMGRR